MKILARYLTGIFIRNYLFASAGITLVHVSQTILSKLLDQTYPASQTLIYYVMDIPHIFVQMTPPAIMMATLLTLSGLSRSNELTACYSIGVGLRHIMVIVLSLVFMISCMVLVLQDRVLPPMFKKRTTYYWRVMRQRNDFFLDVKKDKIWYRSKNLIYNLRTFDPATQIIHGMGVYTFDDEFNLVQVTAARQARYHASEGWTLTDGVVTVFQNDDRFPLSQEFKEKRLPIEETPQDFQEIEKEVDGLRLKSLYAYIQKIRDIGVDTKSYEVKFHSRISLSFIPIVMCFLAIPFSVRNRREGGLIKDVGICLVITFFYWLFYSVGLSLGTNGALPPWLAAWLPSAIFVALAVALISYRRV